MRLCAVNLAKVFSIFQPVGQTAMGKWGIEKKKHTSPPERLKEVPDKAHATEVLHIGLNCLAFAH